MGLAVCGGMMCMCSFGAVPSPLMITPEKRVVSGMPLATIMDAVPMKNILPFGMCSSLANPQVASATAAALGVLTPMPCIPMITGAWAAGSPTVLIGNQPALNHTSRLFCSWGGMIQIQPSGTNTIQIP